MIKNYYKILGLEEGATEEEVERKYNDLLKEFDPTKQPDKLKEFFTSERQKVQEAYNKISLSLIDSNNNNKKDHLSASDLFYLIKDPTLYNTPRSDRSIVTPEFNAIHNVGHEGGEFFFKKKDK